MISGEPNMFIRSAAVAALSRVRRSIRSMSSWRGAADSTYSPLLCIGLLLVVGVAVKIGH
jgi:hypothetical protein